MKKILLSALLLCSYGINQAQEMDKIIPPLRLDSVSNNYYSDGRFTESYVYDENKNKIECLKRWPDGQVFEKILYTYTSGGLLESVRIFENNQFTNNELKQRSYATYEYYPDNRLRKLYNESYPSFSDDYVEKYYSEYTYPDGGEKCEIFIFTDGAWKLNHVNHIDKRKFVLVNQTGNTVIEGVVDESTFTYTSQKYRLSEDKQLIEKHILQYTADWKYILYDEFWKENQSCSYCDPIPDYKKEYIRNAYGQILGVADYKFNTRLRKWEGKTKTYADFYEIEPGVFHNGQTKEDIVYTYVNDNWRQGWQSDYDKLGNTIKGHAPNSYIKTEAQFDYRLLPDGFRKYNKSTTGYSYENEYTLIYELDPEGLPVSVIKDGQVSQVSKSETSENGFRKLIFTYPYLMDGAEQTKTITCLFNADNKISKYTELSSTIHDKAVRKDYEYRADTIIRNQYDTSDRITEKLIFKPDMHLIKRVKYQTDPVYFKSVEWDDKGRVVDSVNVAHPDLNIAPERISYVYNPVSGEADAKHQATGDIAKHPSDPSYWHIQYGYTRVRDGNNMLISSIDYTKNSFMETRTENKKTYHTLYPEVITSKESAMYKNGNILRRSSAVYHYSDWSTTSSGSIGKDRLITLIQRGQELVVTNTTQSSGRWCIYALNGSVAKSGEMNTSVTTISLSGLVKGVYLLKAETGSSNKVFRFIVQ
ncbi:MAG: T9SS type A sorting domain-containing protein [Bacteroidales bacterium]